MARIFNGSTQDARVTSTTVDGVVGVACTSFTYHIWIHTGEPNLATIFDKTDITGPANWNILQICGTGDIMHFQLFDGSNNPIANPAGDISDDTWRTLTAGRANSSIFASHCGGTRDLCCDIFTRDYSNTIQTTLASREAGTDRFYEGELAYAVIWDTDLSANEDLILFRGVNPFVVRNSNIIYFVTVEGNDSPEPNYAENGATATLTASPTKFNGNPPVELLENNL